MANLIFSEQRDSSGNAIFAEQVESDTPNSIRASIKSSSSIVARMSVGDGRISTTIRSTSSLIATLRDSVTYISASLKSTATLIANLKADEPTSEIPSDIDGTLISASRKVVFPGGTRVVMFGTRPNTAVSNAPYYRAGRWFVDKHPDDQRYYVAHIGADLEDRGTTALQVTAIVAGVTVLVDPVIQGVLILIKIGGFNSLNTANNFCTFRVVCANGERFDRTLWFNRQDTRYILEKDPDDRNYYVADFSNDMTDSATSISRITTDAVGVEEIAVPEIQGNLLVFKLGGMDISADPLNTYTIQVDCSNTERFYKVINFVKVDN